MCVCLISFSTYRRREVKNIGGGQFCRVCMCLISFITHRRRKVKNIGGGGEGLEYWGGGKV